MIYEETIKIMAMLGALYGEGKSDPENMAVAWHMILEKYDFKIAQKAVLNYAENDVRDYATFPAVGVIVKEIRAQQMREARPIREIIKAISYGKGYLELSTEAKNMISEEKYNEWLAVDAELFAMNTDKYAEALSTGHALMIE